MSRRDFMKRAVASGMTIAAASHMWVEKAAAETPKKGGHFRVGLDNASTTDSLDPAVMNSEYELQVNMACRNFLIEIDSENNAVPELAESWDASPDAKIWRFKIRKGVKFHNGKAFGPEDVKATLDFHRSEASKSVVKPLLASVTDVAIDGADIVVVTLDAGNADFPYTMTDWHFTMLPSNGAGGVDSGSGIGTGPYVLEENEPGVRTTFKRNPDYWKLDRAHFDEVTFLAINDSTARQNALTTGQVDTVVNPDLKTLGLLAKNPDLKIDEVTSGAAITMPMHVDAAPFDSNDVRMALKLAIDREQVLKTVFQGHGTIGNDHPIAPVLPFWSDMEQRTYDPDKAKYHLKQAGAEGLKVQLSAADAAFSGAVDMAVLYAEQAKAAGIEVEVVREADDGYWSNVWLKKPFCMCYWSGRSTPDSIYSLAYAAGSDWNDTHYKNERFNELMVQARAELDAAKRTEMYAEMQTIYNGDGGTIIPMFRNFLFASRKNVSHGEAMTGHWTLDGGRATERWWFS
jgi:peptide/nickel transport system substrate-binding protein